MGAMKRIGIPAALILAVGVLGLAACPPGSTTIPSGTGEYDIDDPGTYCVPDCGVTRRIVINSDDVTIVGETPDATLTGDGSSSDPIIKVISGLQNVVIRSFRIKTQTQPGILDEGAQGLVIEEVIFDDGGTTAFEDYAIKLQGNEPIVRNCTFRMTNSDVEAIELENSTGALISRNRITTQGPGISLKNCIGITIKENTITYDTDGDGEGGITDNAGASSNCSIVNNTITAGNASAGDGIYIQGTNAIIEGNTIDVSATSSGDGIEVAGTNAVVRGNTIFGPGNGYGINVGGTNAQIEGNTIRSASNSAIYLNAANAVVSGNTIDTVTGADHHGIELAEGNQTITGNTIKNVQNGRGINIGGQDNNVVRKNTLENIAQAGVYINDGDSNEIVDNEFLGIRQHGVYIEADGDNNEIVGNTFRNIQQCGVYIKGDGDNTKIVDNTFEDVERDGVLIDQADNNEISGNKFRRVATGASVANKYAAIKVGAAAASENNRIRDNVIEESGSSTYFVGIHVLNNGSNNNDIMGNTIREAQAGPLAETAVGILVEGGQGNAVAGNTVQNTGYIKIGIDIRTPNRGTVEDNLVEGMREAGIYIRGGTAINKFEVSGNTLTDNYVGLALGAGAAEISGNIVSGGHIALKMDRFGVGANYTVEENCFMGADILAWNEGSGTLVARGNYWHPEPVTGVNIIGDVDFSDPLDTCPGAPTPTPIMSHTYGATAGWYMVSVPTEGDTAGIFGVTLYYWNGTSYDVLSSGAAIEPGKGYWAQLPANTTVTATGTVPTSDVTVDVGTAGWWMISAPWPYDKDDIVISNGTETKSWAEAVSAGWVRDVLYTYDPEAGAYVTAGTLDPWVGYWVRTYEDNLTLKFEEAQKLSSSCALCGLTLGLATVDERPPAPPVAVPLAELLEVVNEPNPVTDVHTTAFKVVGPLASQVELIRVRVYDLSGRLVWEGEAEGPELLWHTENMLGEYLANGIYLYQVQVKVGDTWVTTSLKKLAIYR